MFKKYFSFKGRIGRTEYLMSNLIIYPIGIVLLSPFIMLENWLDSDLILILIGAVSCIYCIAAFWFLLAQGTKRAHDIDDSGWWQLMPLYGIVLLIIRGNKNHNKYGPPRNQSNDQDIN